MTKDRVVVVRGFEYDAFDLAVAFNNVAKERFGEDPFTGVKDRWYLERNPVVFLKVKTGLNQGVKVASGQMAIRGVNGEFTLEGNGVQALVAKDEVPKVESFLDAVKARLKTASIYRSKMVTSSRGFIDLDKIDFSRLVYNKKVLEELGDNLWVLIEKMAQCREVGRPINRKVLFQGKYGVGKTMAVLLTSKKALENGFTVFYLEPTISDASGAVEFMLQVSRRYSPSLLIIEEFDREQRLGGDYNGMSRMMTAIDGVMSKGSEIIVVFTTNHKDKIAAGFQRPGRIDKIINFSVFTAEDAEHLLRTVIPSEFIDPNINWTKVSNAVCHMTPAFIGEGVGVGSTLTAVNRAKNGDEPLVTEEIIFHVFEGLQDQHKACEAIEQTGFSQSK